MIKITHIKGESFAVKRSETELAAAIKDFLAAYGYTCKIRIELKR